MKKILLLFTLFNSILFSVEYSEKDENLSKALFNEMLTMKTTTVFLDYSVSVIKTKKIYDSLENQEYCQVVLEKNPLPPSEIIFEKLESSKYELLEKWNKSVMENQPKNISIDKSKKVRKLVNEVNQMFKSILNSVYEKTKNVIIDSSDENIQNYTSYIENVSSREKMKTNDEAEAIVTVLSKMIMSDPYLYIKTYEEHKILEKRYHILMENKKL